MALVQGCRPSGTSRALSLVTKRAWEDDHQERDQFGEERGEELSEDDGGEHGDEERQQFLQLA